MTHQREPNFDLLSELLAQIVQESMQRLDVPGVAIGIQLAETSYTAGFGVTNINHPLSVDEDTLFQIGSTTKTVTATAAMRLAEMGQLDLNIPIRTYLPNFRLADEDVAARATLQHVFTHTGGWLGDYFDDFGRGDNALTKIVDQMRELPQLTPLGKVWSYNNAGYYLAGRVIEVVSGKPYETAIQELVLDPLGMSNSFFFAEDVITQRVAVGHRREDEVLRVTQPWALARTANPAGGLISSVHDQLKYARFHLGDGTTETGERLLSKETMILMQTAHATAGSLANEVGISWLLNNVAGEKLVMHGGRTNGQLSAFMLIPDHNFAITVLTNSDLGGELYREITQWAFNQFLDLDEAGSEWREVPTSALATYAGLYTAALNDIELRVQGNGLLLQSIPKGGFPKKETAPGPTPPPVELVFVGQDQVLAIEQPFTNQRGDFLRDETGKLIWFRFGGRIHARNGE